MTRSPLDSDLLSVGDVARLSGYSTRTVYRAIWEGRLRAGRPCSRYRVVGSDYWAWLESRMVDVDPAPERLPIPKSPRQRGSLEALRAIEAAV
jgi:excisionase family DNA binding protein